MSLSKKLLLKMYHDMLKIRIFEESAIKLFNQGLIRGPMHVYIGEEAVAVGACSNLTNKDYITSTHRGHGHCIAKGGNPKKMMAELLGKATGYCKGKGGSMHIADPDIGILGANGIVGGGLGIATGAALTAKMMNKDYVSICFFGDGASNQGLFHESLNLAAIWKLPVIYICENNYYGISCSVKEMISVKNIASRAKAYDIKGETIDGNDIFKVYNTVKSAVERAKAGEGPTLIEAKTYRWKGHFIGDPCVYRDEEEVEQWKKKCPINSLLDYLLNDENVSKKEIKKIEADLKIEMEEALEYAKKSPEPEDKELFEDLYV